MKLDSYITMGATGVDVNQNTFTGLDTDGISTIPASNNLKYIVVAFLVICVLRCRCDQIMRRRFISGVFLSVSYLLYLALIPPPSLKFSSSSTGWFNSTSKSLGKAGYLLLLERFYLNLYNYIELKSRMILI